MNLVLGVTRSSCSATCSSLSSFPFICWLCRTSEVTGQAGKLEVTSSGEKMHQQQKDSSLVDSALSPSHPVHPRWREETNRGVIKDAPQQPCPNIPIAPATSKPDDASSLPYGGPLASPEPSANIVDAGSSAHQDASLSTADIQVMCDVFMACLFETIQSKLNGTLLCDGVTAMLLALSH